MPYIYQSTYQQDYKIPNVDRGNVAKQYEDAIKEAETQLQCIAPEKLDTIDEKKCESEWTKLERMELITHAKIFTDAQDKITSKKKKPCATLITKPNKFTEKIDKDFCVSPVGYRRCPGQFETTYQLDYPDLKPNQQTSSPYDNLVPYRRPLQYTELGNPLVPEASTIAAKYSKMCTKHKMVFVSDHRNEISDALPCGKCLCALTEYQDGIGNMGGILKKTRIDGLSKVKTNNKKGKRTCGW